MFVGTRVPVRSWRDTLRRATSWTRVSEEVAERTAEQAIAFLEMKPETMDALIAL